MSDLLARLARTLTHRWGRALALVALVWIAMAALAANGEPATDDFSIPGTETQKALDLLEAHNPVLAGVDSQVVFIARDGTKLSDPANAAGVKKSLDAIGKLNGVAFASNPLDPASPAVSRDQTVGLSNVQYDKDPTSIEKADGVALVDAAETGEGGSLQVEQRGVLIDYAAEQDVPVGELIGIGLAIVLLTLLFRSLAAMLTTLFAALLGVGFGQLLLMAVAKPLGLPEFASIIAVMLGLGAGIDYALLIIARFREQAAAGDSIRDAAAKAAATAGSAVVAAGLIVMVAIAGLLVIGIPMIGKMGVGAAIGIFAVVLSALILLPIFIGAFKRWLRPKKYDHIKPSAFFEGWGARVTARPWVSIIAGVAILLVFAGPVTQMRLGQPDDGNQPETKTQRVAYDAIAKGFGPGTNGPFLFAIDVKKDDPQTQAHLEQIRKAVDADANIAMTQPAMLSDDGEAATMVAIPKTAPQDEATSELLARLREEVIPAATKDTPLQVYIGGNTAGFEDFANKTARGLPLFIAVVIGLSVLLLIAAFRSLWIPLVSAVFNLLSVGAAYGVITAVFQMNVGAELIGASGDIPIVSFIPVMIFAILFGLSMDYNVFLLSRIHEAYNEGEGPRDSVIVGLGRIGKVILFAALIMGSVFLAFVAQPDSIVKMMGLGLGLALLIDVLIVRLVIAPAVVTLLGDKAWWLPGWLDRLLPNVSLEGHLVQGVDPKGKPLSPKIEEDLGVL